MLQEMDYMVRSFDTFLGKGHVVVKFGIKTGYGLRADDFFLLLFIWV